MFPSNRQLAEMDDDIEYPPVFTLSAKDKFALEALEYYRTLIQGHVKASYLEEVDNTIQEFKDWQQINKNNGK